MVWNQRSATSATTRSVALAAERGGDDLDGLLADLPADRGLALGEERRHVGAGGGAASRDCEHALDDLERCRSSAGRRRRAGRPAGGVKKHVRRPVWQATPSWCTWTSSVSASQSA